MRKTLICLLLALMLFQTVAFAGLDSKKAAYIGGTVEVYKGAKGHIEGILNTDDEGALRFTSTDKKFKQSVAIPYKDFIDIEYGQKAGRRVGAAIATAVLLAPVGLFMLFSKKRKHYITIGYKDAEGKEQAAIFELGKDIVRTSLTVIETRSGKKIEYQDEEAKKSAKGQ